MEGKNYTEEKNALINMAKSQKHNFVSNQVHTVEVNLWKYFF